MRLTQNLQHWLGTAFALAAASSLAQTSAAAEPTWDLSTTQSHLSAGLPDGKAVSLRANWLLPEGGNVLAELLDERKFGEHGQVLAVAATRVFSPDWFATGTVALGNGGPNWADARGDVQLSTKWLSQRQLVTSAALYHAVFEGKRSDSGLRLSAAWYLSLPVVLEAGVTLNRSQPGRVASHMPYASATWGRNGQQYISLRASAGTEAYQALGAAAQLVNFKSRSTSINWRYWLAPQWGLTAQAEQYHNPTYQRRTFGVGLFAQW